MHVHGISTLMELKGEAQMSGLKVNEDKTTYRLKLKLKTFFQVCFAVFDNIKRFEYVFEHINDVSSFHSRYEVEFGIKNKSHLVL